MSRQPPVLDLHGGSPCTISAVVCERPGKVSCQFQGMEGTGRGPWRTPTLTCSIDGSSFCPSPHTSQPDSFFFCFCVESCFLFTLTRQKLPPFCQQGYLQMRGLVSTESLWQHGVESGLLRDYATMGQEVLEDGSQQPADHEPVGHRLATGSLIQSFDKEEL